MDNPYIHFYFVHPVYPFVLNLSILHIPFYNFVHTVCSWTTRIDIFYKQDRFSTAKKIWRFQTFCTPFQASNFAPIFFQEGLFCPRGTFSKTSPSLKESIKENEKNLKIGRKKSNRSKKTYRWYFFDLIFSLIDLFFSRFEILSFHQIQLPQTTLSFPIPFLFSPPIPYLFSHKTNPNFHPFKTPNTHFERQIQFLIFLSSNFQTFWFFLFAVY